MLRSATVSIFIIIGNVSWAAYFQNFSVISEGSRDTECWSNDAENSALQLQKYISF